MDDYQRQARALLADLLPTSQHSRVIVIQGSRGGYEIKNKCVDVMQYYNRRDWINEEQYLAGERLFKDYYYAGIYCPKGMEIRDKVDGGSSDGTGEKQQQARQRVRMALQAVMGYDARVMVLNTCCYGYPLKDYTLENYKRSSEKMARFREALDDLARFYNKKQACV